MAKESEKETVERIVTVPLRNDWLKVPRNERGKNAVNTLKTYLSRHMASENIKISQKLNERLWVKGIQKPPSSIRIKAEIDGDVLTARLPEEITPEKEKKKMERIKKGMERILPKGHEEKEKTEGKEGGKERVEMKKDELEKESVEKVSEKKPEGERGEKKEAVKETLEKEEKVIEKKEISEKEGSKEKIIIDKEVETKKEKKKIEKEQPDKGK